MTVGFKKIEMTIPDQRYGNRVVTAYAKGGVAVARIGRGWGVYHAAAGVEVFFRLQRPRLEEAKAVAQALIDLDVEWERKPGDRQFDAQFRAAVGAVRAIAGRGVPA